MKSLFFLIFFLFFAILSFSQPFAKVLVIDSIIDSKNEFNISINSPAEPTNLQNANVFDSLQSQIISVNLNLNNFPNLVMAISSNSPTAEIKLPLDDSGGILILKGVFLLHIDTIRIHKLTLFHNCLSDTVKKNITWYKDFNADTNRHLKLLKSKLYPNKAIIKDCNAFYPSTISFIINRNTYTTSLQTQQYLGLQSWYCHGQKKMSRLRRRLYEKRRANGKPYKYFSLHTSILKFSLLAKVELL